MPVPSVIPTPPGQRWREFRIRVLPVLIFLIALAVAATMWRTFIFPSALVGRVEAVQADVSSPTTGIVNKLLVSRFQRVAAGDPIAEVSIAEPRVMTNTLAVVLAEIESLRAGMGPPVESLRNAIIFDQLRLSWMQQKAQLASSRVNLLLASTELQRIEMLLKNKLVSDSEFDVAKAKKDALLAQVSGEEQLIHKLGETLEQLTAAGTRGTETTNQLQAAIAVQEEKLKLTEAQMCPRLLRAPISGVVSAIRRWRGETVVPGDAIVTIGAEQTDKIVAFLRQPFYLTPKTNMLVQVRTRGYQRTAGLGKILEIGGQLLPINDVLLPPTKYNVSEVGLPILVSLPGEFRTLPGQEPIVHPGEFVDLTILPNGN